MPRLFGELKSESIVTLDKIQVMIANMLKGVKSPSFNQDTITNDCWINKLVYEMSSEEFDKDSEVNYTKLLSSIKQTLEGLNGLIEATKEMSNNGSPFVEIPSLKQDDEEYTLYPPNIPYIELWSKCRDSESDVWLKTVDGVNSYFGQTGLFYLKVDSDPRPSYSDYINPSSNANKTVSLCLNGVSIKDSEGNELKSNYSFLLENNSTVEIKRTSEGFVYAHVSVYFNYPVIDTQDYPKSFFNVKENLGFNSLVDEGLSEISFNLKVVDNRHNQ